MMSNLQEIHDEYQDDFLAQYLHEAIQKINSLNQSLQEKDLTIANLEGELERLHSYLDKLDALKEGG